MNCCEFLPQLWQLDVRSLDDFLLLVYCSGELLGLSYQHGPLDLERKLPDALTSESFSLASWFSNCSQGLVRRPFWQLDPSCSTQVPPARLCVGRRNDSNPKL
eukprot:6461157-Amphidinium_carterae.1